jgi:hypothetical protein
MPVKSVHSLEVMVAYLAGEERSLPMESLVGGSNEPHEDNLCFFRCLAVHHGTPNVQALEAPTKAYYTQYLQLQDIEPGDVCHAMSCTSMNEVTLPVQVRSCLYSVPTCFHNRKNKTKQKSKKKRKE